jgi:anti-sigma B factor antagonist
MDTLNIEERRIGDVTVLDMDGNIRIGGSNVVLQKAIRTLVEQGRNQIVLNLARVAYIDSSGLGELISGHVTLNKNGGQIKLLHLTQRLQELMTITKLLTVFDVYDDESQAVDSFKRDDALPVPTAIGNDMRSAITVH